MPIPDNPHGLSRLENARAHALAWMESSFKRTFDCVGDTISYPDLEALWVRHCRDTGRAWMVSRRYLVVMALRHATGAIMGRPSRPVRYQRRLTWRGWRYVGDFALRQNIDAPAPPTVKPNEDANNAL